MLLLCDSLTRYDFAAMATEDCLQEQSVHGCLHGSIAHTGGSSVAGRHRMHQPCSSAGRYCYAAAGRHTAAGRHAHAGLGGVEPDCDTVCRAYAAFRPDCDAIAFPNCDSDADSYPYGNRDRHGNAHGYRNRDSDAHCDSDINPNAYRHAHGYTDTYPDSSPGDICRDGFDGGIRVRSRWRSAVGNDAQHREYRRSDRR